MLLWEDKYLVHPLGESVLGLIFWSLIKLIDFNKLEGL
jgi:hypothetical protein